ncbi:hypothetical protein [Nocardia speluncae]|nr:hypothetical protein [Nocardia speluncae]
MRSVSCSAENNPAAGERVLKAMYSTKNIEVRAGRDAYEGRPGD